MLVCGQAVRQTALREGDCAHRQRRARGVLGCPVSGDAGAGDTAALNEHSIVLDAGGTGPGQARAFARAKLVGLDPEVVSDAELVLSELVTNAQLHASPPVVVTVRPEDGRVHIAVEDGSPLLPILVRSGVGAMTGRGMALIDALSLWGVTPKPPGKVVWAEVGAGSEGATLDAGDEDLDALLDAWGDEEQPRYRVRLGAVPTALLLTAKEHIDNLVRELTLATGGETAPEPLRLLVSSVVHGFAEARASIKRQAVQAARESRLETELVLDLTADAIVAADAYLAGLDELDRYARAARMLTLESRASHRVFRRWYVTALIDQLRAQVEGRPVPAAPPFPEQLAQELDALSSLGITATATASLYQVGAVLARAMDPRQVSQIVVTQGAAALGAQAGGLALAHGDRLEDLATDGYSDEALAAMQSSGVDDNLPCAWVRRTGEPLWIDSPESLALHHPELVHYVQRCEPDAAALCAVPLPSAFGGVLRFSFRDRQLFDDLQRTFILALADQAAVALDRGGLYAAEQEARRNAEGLARRLDLLTTVTGALTGARDTDEIVTVVTDMTTQQLGARTARIYLLQDDGRLVSSPRVGGDATYANLYEEFTIDAPLPGAEALRTGMPVVLRGRQEMAARFPAIASIYSTDRTLLVAPLTVGDHKLGVLSLTFDDESELDAQAQRAFVSTLADATAQALERALAAESATVANERLAFLADASVLLSQSLDVDTILQTLADLVVPRIGDWCVIHLIEDGKPVTAALAHSDPALVQWAREVEVKYPPTLDTEMGLGAVVATGVSEIYPEITDEMLVGGAVDEEHLRLLRGIGMSSVLIAPLKGRNGIYGALSLVQAQSGRSYGPADRDFVEDIARRAAQAVETATLFTQQQGRLAAVMRVAEVAQRAILADPPQRAGNLRLEARYVSAAAEAKIGGDLFEVVPREGGVRVVVGDVRGKGLDAVRTATLVLGEFRAAAHLESLVDVATLVDQRLRPFFTREEFATAVFIDVTDDGEYRMVSCGHPAPLLCRPGGPVTELHVESAPPLGLGAGWTVTTGQLGEGDRLLAYTDGLSEARLPSGEFIDLFAAAAPLCAEPLDQALDGMLEQLRATTGAHLGDDLALLVVERVVD